MTWTSPKLGFAEAVAIFLVAPIVLALAIVSWRFGVWGDTE